MDDYLDGQFGFERLDVYRFAREALVVVLRNKDKLRGLPGEIASQLERAGVSTVALVAEAAGRQSRADQRNRFVMARAEANEAAAMVELAMLYGAFSDGDHHAIRSHYLRVTRMLTALIRR